jgi:hypothetical protein
MIRGRRGYDLRATVPVSGGWWRDPLIEGEGRFPPGECDGSLNAKGRRDGFETNGRETEVRAHRQFG